MNQEHEEVRMATENKMFREKNSDYYFLTFTLDDEEYGIDVLTVQEILRYERVTRIANSPDFVTGVVNLRGVIIPIVDLRVKLQLRDADFNQNAATIILNLGERVVGIIVDGVSEVLSLRGDQIRPAPDFSVSLATEYLIGLGDINDRMLILVDIGKLLSSEDMALVDSAVYAFNA